MLHRRIRCAFAALTSLTMLVCGIPVAAFAGDNATEREQAATDAAIQESIDALQDMDAGKDYDSSQIIVTYSGNAEPQALELENDQSVEEALEDAIDDDMVVAAQPNYIYRLMDAGEDEDTGGEAAADEDASASSEALSTTSSVTETTVNDTLTSQQYHLDAYSSAASSRTGVTCGADVKAAWSLAKSNLSTTVAVIDTGVDTNHVDLKDNIDTAHMATVATDGQVKVGSITDKDEDDGHGTHVTGIVAATANNATGVSGSSYNARVLPISVFTEQNGELGATSLQIGAALMYLDGLIESGQLSNLHVINMSLGQYSYNSQDAADVLMYSQIKHLYDEHDVVCVCAGGNGNGKNRAYTNASYPGDFDECVAVTALDQYGKDVSWSDYNQHKDISAPGKDILSTFSEAAAKNNKAKCVGGYSKNASYGSMSGTSMASPLVAGIMALMWATYPQLAAEKATELLKSAANPIQRSWGDMRNIMSGSAGAVDAAAAVQAVQDLAVSEGTTAITNPSEQAVVSTKPAQLTVTKLKARKKGYLISWESVKGIAGYQVRVKKKNASSWVKSTLKDALAIANTEDELKSGKKYYVQARAYRLKADGSKVCGAWSTKKLIKTK